MISRELSVPFSHPSFRCTVASIDDTRDAGSPPVSLRGMLVHVGEARLRDIARPGMRVVIAFTDATRTSPDEAIITILLEDLAACGITHDSVTLLCATGLHRPMTEAERIAKLGADLLAKLRIVDHNALDSAGLVPLGDVDGIAVVANRLCAEADLVIGTGVVEPHQYAGYSGGAKTVVIGCGGEATITATHGPAMLDREGVRLARVAGNPFQEFVRGAGRRIGMRYAINVVLGSDGRPVAAAAGAPDDVHDHLTHICAARCAMQVDRAAHIAVLGVSSAKGANLYQASRAVTYVALADRTPLLPGAPVILVAGIEEGGGAGLGERRFVEALAGAVSPAALLEYMRAEGFGAGAQRAYILAQVLVRHPVIVVSPGHADIVQACHMRHAPSVEAALAIAEQLARERFGVHPPEQLECLIVPDALAVLPVLG